jgi:hypothetical protein
MSDEDDQLRELIKSQQKHCPVVPPVSMETHGLIQDRAVENVLKEGAVALILGEDLAGHSWAQGINLGSEVWLRFWVMVLAVENQELGSFYIDAPRKDAGSMRYQHTVEALARMSLGVNEEKDRKIVAANVRPSHYIHKQQIDDVYRCAQKMRAENPPGRKKDQKKRGAAADKDTEDPVPKKTKQVSIASVFASPLKARMIIARGASEDLHADNFSLDVAIPKLSHVDDEVINKVTFTLAIVKNEAGDAVVGYLVRFLVHDARWNPGEEVNRLVSTAKARDSNVRNANFKEPYVHYANWQKTHFPAYDMTWERWIKAGNVVWGSQPSFEELNRQMGRQNRPDELGSDMCPLKMSSLRRAWRRLKEAGGNVGSMSDYYSIETTATWPSSMEVYKEMPSRVFWDHTDKVGFFGQTFPRTLSIREENPELHTYLENTFVPSKNAISNFVSQNMRYRTGNVIIHMAEEADEMEKMARRKDNVKHVCATQMEKFRSLCLPSLDALEHLGHSKAAKATIRWMLRFMKSHETVTRETELYDANMTLFGNLKARQMVQYEKVFTIVQAVIPMKIVIVFSVYRRQKGLLGHFLVYGDAGGGKSFLTNEFARDRFIPGTFELLDRLTDSADQTDMNVIDEIRGFNEVPEHLVSEEAGRKKPDAVNAKKSHLTEGGGSIRTYKEVDLGGAMGKVRGARVSKQILNYTEICCSNTHPDDGALMSRYHMHLMLQPKIPTNEMDNDDVDPEEDQTVTDNFRVNQFFSCWIEKAMTCYAIPCRKPFMKLFKDISARMIQVLKDWDIVNPKNVDRPLSIMTHTARELTKERAKMLTYDVKGAVHYGKQFDPRQLTDLAPHLWCDTEITLLTWTLHSSDWIKDEFSNVLQAMCKVVLNEAYDVKKTPYQYYQMDVDGKIKFKTDRNFSHSPEDGKLNRYYIDLNNLQIDGENHAAIAREISSHTNPYMPPIDVLGTLKKMSRHSFTPRVGANGRNGYTKRVLCDNLKNVHRASMAMKTRLSRKYYKGAVDALVIEYAQTIKLDVCKRITDLPDYAYRDAHAVRTHEKLREIFKTELDWVIIHLHNDDDIITLKSLPLTLMKLRHETQLSQEDMRRVVNAFEDITVQHSHDVFAEVEGLTYPYARFILFALENGWIAEKDNLETRYLKIPMVKERVPFPRYASEDDLDTLSKGSSDHTISIVDMSQKKRICFSPMAIELYDKQVILDAFIFATLCKTMRPGKYLLGWSDPRDDSRLQTLDITKEFIEDRCRQFDMDSPEGAVSRFEGIPFKRRGYREKSTHTMMYGIEKARTVVHKRDKNIEIVADLDKWAAEQQARKCKLDEAPNVHYMGAVGDINYPEEQIQDKIRHSMENWVPNASTKNTRNIARIRK